MSESKSEILTNLQNIINSASALIDNNEESKRKLFDFDSLEDLIKSYNDMIDKGYKYTTALQEIEEFRANKYNMMKQYNMIIKDIKSHKNLGTNVLGNMMIGGGLIRDVGDGLKSNFLNLISRYNYDKEYSNLSFNSKLDKMDGIEKKIKEINTKHYTPDLKKKYNDYLKSVQAYKSQITKLKDNITNTGSSKSYAELIKNYVESINKINESKNYNDTKTIDLNYKYPETVDYINKITKFKNYKLNENKDKTIIADLTKKTTIQQNKLAEYEKRLKSLQKAVQQYKQNLKIKSGNNVIPTLSSAVRFSKVGSLLDLPSPAILESLKSKSKSKDLYNSSSGPISYLDGAIQNGKEIQTLTQQQIQEEIPKLNDLFSYDFINELKIKRKTDILLFLVNFNKTKSPKFMKRIPNTTYIQKFSDFLRLLKTLPEYEIKAKIYDKFKSKDISNPTYIDNIIDLIKTYINFDNTGLTPSNTSNIAILYKMLDEILDTDSMYAINTGKLISIINPLSAQNSVKKQSQQSKDISENEKKILKDFGGIIKRYLGSNSIISTKNTYDDIISTIKDFFTNINNIIDNSDISIKTLFNNITIGNIQLNTGGADGNIYNNQTLIYGKIKINTFLSMLNKDDKDGIYDFISSLYKNSKNFVNKYNNNKKQLIQDMDLTNVNIKSNSSKFITTKTKSPVPVAASAP